MNTQEFLAARFDANRTHLRAVAYRMLGSLAEADDAVQEAWLRLARAEASDIANLGGWLTTVVARVCLDMLRARKSRGEEPFEAHAPEAAAAPRVEPEHEVVLADSVGLALLVVLQTLAPAERVAFVLHDLFDLSFDEIGPIVGRTSTAARQLASRARRRVQGKADIVDDLEPADLSGQRAVVEAFLAASRGGSLEALLAVLDPDVEFRGDAEAMRLGGPAGVRGAAEVARFFQGRATSARAAIVDGGVGAVVAPLGKLFLVLRFTVENGRIRAIEAVADPAAFDRMNFGIFEES